MQATATPLPSIPLAGRNAIFLLALILMAASAGHGQLTFQSLIDQAKGDTPVAHLKFRCTNCGSRLTVAAVSGRHLGSDSRPVPGVSSAT